MKSNSQQKGVGRKSLLFSSKLVMLAMALIIIGAAFGAFAILQHSRDSKAATGMILNIPFDTDFSGQGLQRVSSDRLRIVSQADNGVKPVQGAGMARIELRKGDNPLAQWCCANTARSEFTTQTNEQKGENRWYSWSSMFDPTFPSYPTQPANGGWQIFLQWHGNDSVSPPMAFFASNDNIALGVSDGSRWNYYWQAPMNRGSWHNFKMHVTWGDSGRIELWHNGSKVLDKSGVDNITSPPLYVKGGMYRNDDLAKTAILYMDSFKMAWDEASLGSVPTNNTGTPVVPTQPPPQQQQRKPYLGNNWPIPGKIEAENYDEGGEGVAYHDLSSSNQGGKYRSDGVDIENSSEGGFNVGWNEPGEWQEYTANVQAGKYNIDMRVGSAIATGKITLKLDGTTIATANIPNTGEWQKYQTISLQNISLPGGNGKKLRAEVTGSSYTLNWINFSLVSSSQQPGGPITPPTTPPNNPTNPSSVPLVTIAGSGVNKIVPIPNTVKPNQSGQFIADFDGDGNNDVAVDINGDGNIDTSSELITNFDNQYDSPQIVQGEKIPNNYIDIGIGPLPETKVSKKLLYLFATIQALSLTAFSAKLYSQKLARLIKS